MNNRNIPSFHIEQFHPPEMEHEFYANVFSTHLAQHHFIQKAHAHDFYLSVLFTRGSGTHEIDFASYKIQPGSVFTMNPGQVHNWQLSADIEGYIFFHTRSFYELSFSHKKIQDYPFFQSIYNSPLIRLKKEAIPKIENYFKEILLEYQQNKKMKYDKLHACIELLYIELTRTYEPIRKEAPKYEGYLHKVRQLETLIDAHFKIKKYPHEYADLMNISEKHLNRICKTCLNKTTSALIADRVILEAKRMLIRSEYSVSEVAEKLGYYDYSYFTRFFKKHCDETPVAFRNKYR